MTTHVEKDALRALFNEHVRPRIDSGELTSIVTDDRKPASLPPSEPFCTRSQFVRYITRERAEIAGCHQYLRPDGQVGASGKPDPKIVVHEGVAYKIDTGPG